jgi:phage shock protein C
MEPKKIFRSRNNKVIGGVAGGIGEYFNIDPIIVRLLLILFTILGGAGIIMYIVLLLFIPLNPNTSYTDNPADESNNPPVNDPKETFEEVKENLEDLKSKVNKSQVKNVAALICGILLIVWGGFILLKRYIFIRIEFWPIFLICLGLLLLVLSFNCKSKKL